MNAVKLLATMILVAFIVAVGAPASKGQGHTAPNLEKIRKAWEARQTRVKSAHFVITEEQTDIKGSLNGLAYGPDRDRVEEARRKKGLPPLPPGLVLPPKDWTNIVRHEYWLDGDKFRYHFQGMHSFNTDTMQYRLEDKLTVFDGVKLVKSLDADQAVSAKDVPGGTVWKDAHPYQALLPTSRPITMTYRPVSPSLGRYYTDRMTVTGRQAVIDGSRCFELLHPDSAQSATQLWVNPDLRFAITRYVITTKETPTQRIDVAFARDEAGEPRPVSYVVSTYGMGGGLQRSQRGQVTDATLNRPIDPEKFQLEFPKGTIVIDQVEGSYYVVPAVGQRRYYQGDDFKATYHQVMASNSGNALGNRPRGWFGPAAYVGLIVIAGSLIATAVVRWRRTRLRAGPAT